jgi:anhydro-N-acetylmuramic acid kinase
MLVLGIMSGTSIDGIDYSLCEVSRRSIRLVRHWAKEFPPTLRRQLHNVAANESTSHETAQAHHDLGRLYARQAVRLRPRPSLVGLHGQTIFHNPNRRCPATLQLGEPSYIAEILRVPVISNFRAADIAAGGQGAPLATLFHQRVFARRGRHVAVNNLGGISNVTSLNWARRELLQILAFDTGPANVLLDLAVRHYTGGKQSCDKDGAWAQRGTIHQALLVRWLAHSYFKETPPKSTGRELFGERFWRAEQKHITAARLSKFDVLATLTEFTAQSIALNYRRHLPAPVDSIILCGGGARNRFLVERITAAVPENVAVTPSNDFGWPAEAIEAAAFAFLAYQRWTNQTGNISETTGARHRVLLGQITHV